MLWLPDMEAEITYRGRTINNQNVAEINRIISANPEKSRCFISREICRLWDWRQPNGVLKDMVCRSLLLLLESKGLITLPARKCTPHNPLANRKKPAQVVIDQTPVESRISDMAINLVQIRRTRFEKMFNSLIDQYHYLGYTQPVGEHLKYMAFSHDRPVACLTWASAPWHIGARDRFIGWSKEVRRKNLHLIANNTRFLILPWVRVAYLASHLLSVNRRHLSEDWQRLYHHPIHLVETFVDTQRYRGTCYRADNWIHVGDTTGRGKGGKSHKAVLPIKAVYVFALTSNFHEHLCHVA